MNSIGERLLSFYRRLPAWTTPILVIVLGVLLGNIMYVSGLASNDPISWTSGIAHTICRVTCGRPMIDPNVGFLTQPLGHLAAMDLLHGHLPWWNYFEGLGQPLAGEMQGASLFPLTLLFAIPSGLLWFHITLEVIAGVATYFLARRLSMPVVIATAAGLLFALNGTFAWLGNAVLNPVAFLPMLLLGIEMIYEGARTGSRRGWYVAAIALSLSIYSGFPEVAFLDSLMATGWAIVRLFSVPPSVRLVAARRVGLAGLIGTLISLPILVPFYDFMRAATVQGHVATVAGSEQMPVQVAPMFLDPYIYGTLNSNHAAANYWGVVGGYFLASVAALALLGLFGSRLRPLRLYLGGWIIVGLFGGFNFFHFHGLWNIIPFVNTIALPRYIIPSCEMAMILLATLGIMDLASAPRARRLYPGAIVVVLALTLWSALSARSTNSGVVLTHTARIIFLGLHAIPFIALGLLLILGFFTKAKMAPLLIALILVGESLLIFFVPTAEAPKQITIDESSIQFLQANLGQQRFLDFAVLYPNWGTQYGLNSLSAIDLPFPHAFADFITKSLFPGLTPSSQFVIHGGMTGIIAQENMLVQHFAAYQGASVKYLLIPSQVPLLPSLAKLGVTEVFKTDTAAVYLMPNFRPFYSTSSATCTVQSPSVNLARVACSSGGTTLLRTELSMKGWHAYVNGREVPITTIDGVYQSVAVPAGTSTVTYTFEPPHVKYAILVGLLAVFYMIGSWFIDLRRRRVVQPRETH